MGNQTDRIRAMLHERGIEHLDYDKNNCEGTPILETQWQTESLHATYTEYPNKENTTRLVVALHPTPEQAIDATVGERYEMHICKRCGVAYELNIIDEGFGKSRFCPNCGYSEMYQ